jgi:hypothetical protein
LKRRHFYGLEWMFYEQEICPSLLNSLLQLESSYAHLRPSQSSLRLTGEEADGFSASFHFMNQVIVGKSRQTLKCPNNLKAKQRGFM